MNLERARKIEVIIILVLTFAIMFFAARNIAMGPRTELQDLIITRQ